MRLSPSLAAHWLCARTAAAAGWLALVFAAPAAEAFIINPGLVPWTTTASGSRTANGQPVTLTWSIVPDGSTITEANIGSQPSDLIAFLDLEFGSGPGGSDLTQRPWFTYFEQSFDRWEELGGATYLYEPNDDGGTHSNKSGVLGVRGDVRIGGTSIDGPSGTLAFNFLPPGNDEGVIISQGGDMVLDTDDGDFYDNPANNFRALRNVIMHEHGHGFGLEHVESNTDNLLMEPFINTSFDGPQLDDIRAIHFYFGDANEKSNGGAGNGTAALATGLGSLTAGGLLSVGSDADVPDQRIEPDATDFVSVANLADVDFYSFTVDGPTLLDATLTPRGGQFNQSGEGGTPTPFDADARVDLELAVFDSNGTFVLGSSDSAGLGGVESLQDLLLPDAGEYFVRVTGSTDTVQLYELSLFGGGFLEADFTLDGSVDQADQAIWEAAFGLNAGGDADGDLDTDLADLLIVQQQFGQLPPGGGVPTIAAVPEPGGAVLLLGFFTLAGTRRLRR